MDTLSWFKYIFYANNIECQVRFMLLNSLALLPYNFWMITVSFSILTVLSSETAFNPAVATLENFPILCFFEWDECFSARCKPLEDKLLELGWLLSKDEHEAVDVLSLWSMCWLYSNIFGVTKHALEETKGKVCNMGWGSHQKCFIRFTILRYPSVSERCKEAKQRTK